MHHQNFALFSQTVYAVEKWITGFNMQVKIGINQTLIWLHHKDVKWVYTASSSILHSQLMLLGYCGMYDIKTSNAVYSLF